MWTAIKAKHFSLPNWVKTLVKVWRHWYIMTYFEPITVYLVQNVFIWNKCTSYHWLACNYLKNIRRISTFWAKALRLELILIFSSRCIPTNDILLCLMIDNFSYQWESVVIEWVNYFCRYNPEYFWKVWRIGEMSIDSRFW
jgi:hypothetical protein